MPIYAKRGEPLIVDIAPDKPEQKAPLGDPARPLATPPPAPAPSAAEAPAPKQSIPPAPPPKPAAPARPSPPPEPPKQVAKAPPPEPVPQAKAPPPPAPAPAPPAPVPEPPPQPREAQPPPTPTPPAPPTPAPPPQAPTASETTKPLLGAPKPPSSGSQGAGSQTALAKPGGPAAGMFRNPPGGGGLQGGRGGTAGEPIPLDTPDPNYREYMDKVKQRIYSKWGYPYEAQSRGLQGKLTIEFHIAKDGHLQFIQLRSTSGEEILDTVALTAVKLGSLYPPLPDAMQRDVLPVVGIFVYTLRGPLSILQSLQ